jgi:hypothetical protein
LAKNAELDQQTVSHDQESSEPEGEELRVDSCGDLLDDIMLLNEEVDAHDEHLVATRQHLHSLAAILQSAKAEAVGEMDPHQKGAELALGLASELTNLHVTVERVLKLVESVSNQRKGEASLSSLHHMLQLPTLVSAEVGVAVCGRGRRACRGGSAESTAVCGRGRGACREGSAESTAVCVLCVCAMCV